MRRQERPSRPSWLNLALPGRSRGGPGGPQDRGGFSRERPTIGGRDEDLEPIGVPPGYVAPYMDGPRGPRNLSGMSATAAEGWASQGAGHGSQRGIQPVPPRYFEGDEFTKRPHTREQIAAMQQKLAVAGLLTDYFVPGVWDPKTAEAYREILAMANASGMNAQQVMSTIGSTAEGGTGGVMRYNPETGSFEMAGEVAGEAQLAPPQLVTRITDPKVLKSVFRAATIDTLGIGWSEQELDQAVAAYNQVERSRQRQQYDAQLAAGQLMGVQPGQEPVASEVVDIPSPEGWVDAYMREKDPGAVQEAETLNMVDSFMQLAGGTAWGVGRQI